MRTNNPVYLFEVLPDTEQIWWNLSVITYFVIHIRVLEYLNNFLYQRESYKLLDYNTTSPTINFNTF